MAQPLATQQQVPCVQSVLVNIGVAATFRIPAQVAPLFRNLATIGGTIAPGFDVEHANMIAVCRIASGVNLAPNVDFTSHREVYLALRLARYLGLDDEIVSRCMAAFVQHNMWHTLRRPEWMYLASTINENAVDFRKYFRVHKAPFEMIARMCMLREMHEPQLYIDALMFFKHFDFTTCFDQNNDEINAKIRALREDREKSAESFLIDPHTPFMQGYFTYKPLLDDDVWRNTGIAPKSTLAPGDSVIASLETTRENFRTFTCGKYVDAPNPALRVLGAPAFPYDRVVFAGGAIAKILDPAYNPARAMQSDVDMFVIGSDPEQRRRAVEAVLKWFETYDRVKDTTETYYALRGSVVSMYLMGVARKYQIISNNRYRACDIIGRFDLTHIQWCYHNGRFLGTPEAVIAMTTRRTKLTNSKRLRLPRVIKALHSGYDVVKHPLLEDAGVNLGAMLEPVVIDGVPGRSMQLERMIRQIFSFFYPQPTSMSREDERQHILAQIEKDSDMQIVTISPANVVNNLTIGGDFGDSGYESRIFTTFNNGTVVTERIGNDARGGNRPIIVRNKFGPILLSTEIVRAVNVIVSDTGVTVKVATADPNFAKFCRDLVANTYRLFGRGMPNSPIDADGNVPFVIAREHLNTLARSGRTALRNQRGDALNIEEDIATGDRVQVLFTIEVNVGADNKYVKLVPNRFTKFVEVHIEDEAAVPEIPAGAPEFNAEIEYQDV